MHNTSTLSTDQLLAIATQAALEAGRFLQEQAKKEKKINFEDTRDVKLQADVDSEHIIRKVLSDNAPFPIVGEELGGDIALCGSDQLYWVIDPIDGTYNYLRNSPLCCISVGLLRGLEPVIGVIYDFNTNQIYQGNVEKSLLTVNGKPHIPTWANTIEQACLATGFPTSFDLSGDNIIQFSKQIQKFKKIRMLGSAALQLTYVSLGWIDVYCETPIRLWDIAGALALLKAVGGHFRLESSKTAGPFAYNIWAAGRKDWLDF